MKVGDRVQFERLGYFCVDKDSTTNRQVWNRTIGLRDSWAKLEKKLAAEKIQQARDAKKAKKERDRQANKERKSKN